MKLIIIIFLAVTNITLAQIFNEKAIEIDTSQKPILDFVPKEMKIINDTSQFFTTDVTILNRGGGILKIKEINASCYCSNGYVLKNDIESLSTGTIQLNINKKGLEEGQNSVVFSVFSNATNSPTFYTIKFIDKNFKQEQNE